jgi:putative spermidine/putrescine transport system substrate-binding protein
VTGSTRRGFLAGAAAAATAVAVEPSRAAAQRSRFDGVIRVAGLGGYDLLEPIRKRAEKDLGFSIVSMGELQATVERWARQTPGMYDVYSGFSQLIRPLWPAGGFQPVEIARITRWAEINPLFKLGKVRPGDPSCTFGEGAAPFRVLYLDPHRSGKWRSATGSPRELDGLLVQWANSAGRPTGPEPRFCTGVPNLFNFDSLGYNPHVVHKRPEQVSWAELMNDRWRGRVALQTYPDLGLYEAATAVRAAGLVRIPDLGNLTRRDIDALVKVLLAYKKRKHFFGVWSNSDDAADWMTHGQVVIEPMYATTIARVHALRHPVRQAAPPEGYRAFGDLFSISSEVKDRAKLQACYDFINWWHTGFAGSVLVKEGYYNAVEATSRQFLPPGEYAYWVEGRPADRNYTGPNGEPMVRKGQVRDGGALAERACRIAVWDTRASKYVQKRWYDFVLSF